MNYIKHLIVCVLVLCLCLLLFSSCRSRSDEVKGSEWTNRDTWISSGAASEQGYYYFRDDYFLCFYDFASQKSVYLCDKSGCTHRDGDCHAYMLFANPSALFFYNNQLYFLESQADGLKLTRRDADGSNYEEILTLMQGRQEKDATMQVSDYRVCDNLLYYIGSVLKDPGDGRLSGTAYLYQITLNTGKEELLLELGEKGAAIVAARRGQVLLQQNQETPKAPEEYSNGDYNSKEYLSSVKHLVMLWDEKAGEARTLLEDNRWNLLGALAAYDDSYYIIRWDDNHESNYVEQISIDTDEKKTILTLDCKVANYSLPSNNELLFFLNSSRDWNSFLLPNFSKQTLSFLEREDNILYSTDNGYIINRMLEYEGDLDTGATITKSAYSYLSFEDAKAGKENYVDFYIRDNTKA